MTDCPMELAALAAVYGVQTTYFDVSFRQRSATPDTLQAVLLALGVPSPAPAEARDRINERRLHIARQGVEPVIVAWNGAVPHIEVTLPAEHAEGRLRCRLERENGEQTEPEHRRQVVATDPLADDAFIPHAAHRGADGITRRDLPPRGFVTLELHIDASLEWGYHRLRIETPVGVLETCVVAAPDRAFEGGTRGLRRWGCFLPLYALRTGRDWGSGDFADLVDLRAWVRGAGGDMTATLPLLAAYLDEPCDPSPYAPASRLFWNEFYVAPERTPEFAECEPARQLFGSAEFQSAIAALRARDYVDYRSVMHRKRQVLSLLAQHFFACRPPRFAEFERFAGRRPRLRDYAEFRATCERRRENWQRWPARLRDGNLSPGDYDESAAAYHCYVQWVANEQLHQLADGSDGIDLDLPLGVRTDGYDVWRHRDAYAADTAAGAPPDTFFTKGQNWGFAPLHPDGVRQGGYRHFREILTHHMESASTLRLDHVMSLRRLYWIPRGFAADQGAYVRYRMDELLAVLCLASHRHRTTLIGENLGTVPPEVNEAMARHGLRKMFVVQYECGPDAVEPLRSVPHDCVASLNTHDMPTFAAWWTGADIADRLDLGLLDERDAAIERAGRAELRRRLAGALNDAGWLDRPHGDSIADGDPGAGTVVAGLLKHLAASPAEMVLINLEDLWQEPRPQNVPGTWLERPNWTRKTRFTLEELRDLTEVVACLRDIDGLRRQAAGRAR